MSSIQDIYGCSPIDAVPESHTLENRRAQALGQVGRYEDEVSSNSINLQRARQNVLSHRGKIDLPINATGQIGRMIQKSERLETYASFHARHYYLKQEQILYQSRLQQSQAELSNINREIAMQPEANEADIHTLDKINAQFNVVFPNMKAVAILPADEGYSLVIETGEHRIFGGDGGCVNLVEREVCLTVGAARPSYRIHVELIDQFVSLNFYVNDPFNLEVAGNTHDSDGPLLRNGYSSFYEEDEGSYSPGLCSYGIADGDGDPEKYMREVDGYEYSGIPHPHLLHEGDYPSHQACLGSFEAPIMNAMRDRSWIDLAVSVMDFITSYNDQDCAGKFGPVMFAEEFNSGSLPAQHQHHEVWQPVCYLTHADDCRTIGWVTPPPSDFYEVDILVDGDDHGSYQANMITGDFCVPDETNEVIIATNQNQTFTLSLGGAS